MLTDPRAWDTAGAELRLRDPARYVAILKVVEEICSIHRAPLAPADGFAFLADPPRDDGDFD